MQTIYVDNFRGFFNTYIPLKDVNFLVGENSTGKTSILSLINIISSHSFWFNPSFYNETVDLGFFDEIANKNKGKSFTIGLLNENDKKRPFGPITLTFKENDGAPVLSEVNFLENGISYKIVLFENKIKFNKTTFTAPNESSSLDSFKEWIEFQKNFKQKFKIEKFDNDYYGIYAPFFQISNLLQKRLNDNKVANSITRPYSLIHGNVTWIAPIRAKSRRTYDSNTSNFSPEGSHIPYVLRTLLLDKKKQNISSNKKVIDSILDFGKESGLFNSIEIKPLGKSKAAPFEVIINFNNSSHKMSNVGYGVSQILPVLIEALTPNPNNLLIIQQPEVHLHPKAQAAIGELFYKISSRENKQFLIETHSDYTIDRFRYCIFNQQQNPINGENSSNKAVNKDDSIKLITSQVMYFERTSEGNNISFIEIDNSGQYSTEQPDSFRDFFIKEELKLIQI